VKRKRIVPDVAALPGKSRPDVALLPCTVTVAERLVEPPGPLQLRVKILLALVSAPVLAVPEVGCEPLHAPLAVHELASVEDQLRLELPPLGTLAGVAVTVSVGAGDPEGGGADVMADSPPPPPQPATKRVHARARRTLRHS